MTDTLFFSDRGMDDVVVKTDQRKTDLWGLRPALCDDG